MIAPGQNEALYLFYVTGSELPGDVEGSDTSRANSFFTHRYGDFVSLLGIVSIDEFCGPEAERNLGDLGWIGERALRHQRAIEQGFRRGPVLPARFGTLFSSLSALERFIDANREAISDFLERVRGQEEWGIKALLERSAASRWLRGHLAGAACGEALASPGLRYIQQRRADAAAEKQMQSWLLEACESVAESLDEYAIDRRQGRILDGAAEDSRELVLNLAALIPRARRDDLITHIGNINAERAEQGLSFVLNGPWPPYSFCPPLATP
jgi:hypothetical protein